jgi:hypothetical protein
LRFSTAVKIQIQVFWVVTPCSVSRVHAASIFSEKIQVQVIWVVTPCSVSRVYAASIFRVRIQIHGVTTQMTMI